MAPCRRFIGPALTVGTTAVLVHGVNGASSSYRGRHESAVIEALDAVLPGASSSSPIERLAGPPE